MKVVKIIASIAFLLCIISCDDSKDNRCMGNEIIFEQDYCGWVVCDKWGSDQFKIEKGHQRIKVPVTALIYKKYEISDTICHPMVRKSYAQLISEMQLND